MDVEIEKKPRAPRTPRTPKPPASVEELVQHALKLAATNPKAKWTGKSAKALFNENEENHKAARDRCLNTERPLLKQTADGAILTSAGFEAIVSELPIESFPALVKATAAGMSAPERVTFLQGLIGRTPSAASELTPLLDEAIVAKKVELEEQAATKAKLAAVAAANRAALERALALSQQDLENEITALKRQWEALGQKLKDLPPPPNDRKHKNPHTSRKSPRQRSPIRKPHRR